MTVDNRPPGIATILDRAFLWELDESWLVVGITSKGKHKRLDALKGVKDMTTAQTTEMHETISRNDAEEMTRYGIKKVSIEYFYLGVYGYPDLKDAIAQAKRELNAAVKKKR